MMLAGIVPRGRVHTRDRLLAAIRTAGFGSSHRRVFIDHTSRRLNVSVFSHESTIDTIATKAMAGLSVNHETSRQNRQEDWARREERTPGNHAITAD